MAYEHSTPEHTFFAASIGRRQALCTLAGIASAVAGISLLGIGSSRAAEAPAQDLRTGEQTTVSADEALRRAEQVRVEERELAMARALIPSDLDLGKWSIEQVYAPRLGAIAVVMRTPEGQAFQVDVLRRDGDIPGVAETRNFSLYIANSGNGSTATDELQARGAKVLAHHIRNRELTGVPAPELLTFRQREDRFPLGQFAVLG